MQCVAVAHALTSPKLGPLAPVSIAITPLAVLPNIAGIVKGDTFEGPDAASLRTCFSNLQ
jgi:hypothetical protein